MFLPMLYKRCDTSTQYAPNICIIFIIRWWILRPPPLPPARPPSPPPLWPTPSLHFTLPSPACKGILFTLQNYINFFNFMYSQLHRKLTYLDPLIYSTVRSTYMLEYFRTYFWFHGNIILVWRKVLPCPQGCKAPLVVQWSKPLPLVARFPCGMDSNSGRGRSYGRAKPTVL